jgi:hypothetical protein
MTVEVLTGGFARTPPLTCMYSSSSTMAALAELLSEVVGTVSFWAAARARGSKAG